MHFQNQNQVTFYIRHNHYNNIYFANKGQSINTVGFRFSRPSVPFTTPLNISISKYISAIIA